MASESGPLLRSARLRDFNALGSVGRPVYASAPQIRATLRRQIGAEAAAMLAIPQIGESGENVDWYAPEGGLVVPWSAAAPEERDAMRAALQAAREKVAAHAQTLGAQLEARPASATADDFEVYARLLPHVLRIPDESHIYSVDGKPVVTFWGFTAPGLPDADPIRDLMPAAAVAAVAAAAPNPPPLRDPVPVRPWWRWLLPLLLLLLGLGLLLWLLRGCAPEVLPPALRPADLAVPVDPARPGGTVVVPGVEVPGVVVPGVTVPGGVVPGTVTTPDGATPPPEAAQPPNAPADGQQPPPPQPDAQTPDAQTQPPQPEAQKPDAQTPPEARKPGAASTPESPLVIPPEAQKSGSTDFLNGTWTSRGGLMDDRTGLPVVVQYGFENGKGTVTYTRPDGTVCKGASAAAMQGGRLVITGADNVRCNDGSAYARTDVTCTPGADGRARCAAKPAQGPEYSVDIGR